MNAATSTRPLALITGGTSGIGYGIAKKLVAECDLALAYASNHERAKVAQHELSQGMNTGATVKTYSGNLSSYEEAKKLIENIRDDFGRSHAILLPSPGSFQVSSGVVSLRRTRPS